MTADFGLLLMFIILQHLTQDEHET